MIPTFWIRPGSFRCAFSMAAIRKSLLLQEKSAFSFCHEAKAPVRAVLSHPFLVPAAQGAPFLRVARQGATGDPRLPSRHKALASQAPPSRGWHVASCHPAPPST